MKRVLAVLRAGPNSIHHAWSENISKVVDLAVSTYGDAPKDRIVYHAKYQHHFDGSKLGGIRHFFNLNKDLLVAYDHIWLLEDDLFIPTFSAVRINQVASSGLFDLFQPALAPESHYSFALTVCNPRFFLRVTDFVEQMSPVFSVKFLTQVLPYFDENYSGSGQEWLWQRILEEGGRFCAIVDCAPIYHTRRVGEEILS